MGKYKKKCVYVEVKDIEALTQNLMRELAKLRSKAEREIQKNKPMTAGQVAEYLGIHRYTVYQLIKNDGLPVIKIHPRCLRFDKEEVKRWMKQKGS